MKYLIAYVTFIISLTSCDNREKDNIEIYLLKERRDNIDGIKLSELSKYAEKNNINFTEFDSSTTYDTVNKKLIFASDFKFKQSDLKREPFIKNEEIIGLDLQDNKIEFSNSGGFKILKLKPNMRKGEQFVIVVNKKPVMNGYLYSPYSSNGSTWVCIQYDDFKTVNDSTLTSYKFSIFKGDGTSDRSKRESIDFAKYPELLEAFTKTDRILK